ncbi:MAG: carbohydrate binding domain-containing protein [Anaerolineales bacterium]
MTIKTNWLRWTFFGLMLTLLPFGTYRGADAYPLDSSDPLNTNSYENTPIIRATNLGDSNLSSIFLPIIYNKWFQTTIPVANSTLLPPGSTQIELTVQTAQTTTCRYALDSPDPYNQMAPFGQSGGSTHKTVIRGLNPDPNTVNHVYVRCADQPEIVQEFLVRALSDADPPFPRTANLWGWDEFFEKGWDYMARIDLWVLWDVVAANQIAELRSRNPDIRVLTSINAVEHNDLPDDYYLKDVNGNKIAKWPGVYRLNITKDYVAEYQAHYAYQTVLDTGLMADGVFFDNVFTTQSWLKFDVNGNPVEIDANEDGIADDPAALDAAWKSGILHELETFRQLMPHAITNGHAMKIEELGIAELFNGVGAVYWTGDALEDQIPFYDLWNDYKAWMERAKEPQVTMIESSPLDDIAYGYGFPPQLETNIPPSTFEFAHTYYPWVRFGLALTLMNDGYFLHDFGDLWHGQDWWYDELDFDLGYPLGPAVRVDGIPAVNLIVNGGFESDPIVPPWSFVVMPGNAASLVRDMGDAQLGMASARIDIAATSGTNWHIMFYQDDLSMQQGVTYDVTFWAKSSAPRYITLSALKSSGGSDNYGLLEHVAIDTGWQEYTVSFEATATVSDAKLQFSLGETSDNVWLDDVRMNVRPPDVYRREFTNGVVLLNATHETQTINVGSGFSRLEGNQAAMVETILDDNDPGFSISGTWSQSSYDSGSRGTSGPYYHDWGSGCHESDGGGDVAQWDLPIPALDTYTISAWWPAAPEAVNWNSSVTYEVFADGKVITSNLDQRSGGDEWNLVAEVQLAPGDAPYVRMTCTGSAPCIADALLLRSKARYNDGSTAAQVTLQPMDGIVLRRH